MKKITLLFTILTLAYSTVSAQTMFDFDTNATDNGDDVSETIDGITVTFSTNGAGGANIEDWFGWLGSTDNVVVTGTTTSTTFVFSEPVDVHSILPIDANGVDEDYTFTPTGGTNSSVVISLVGGGGAPGQVPVDLNWTNVTSFTVTGNATGGMVFDNLSVSAISSPPPVILFDFDTNATDNGDDVSETIDGITVTFSTNGAGGANIEDWFGWLGSADNVVVTGTTTSTTFVFSESVDVHSILPIDANGVDEDYTFTPTGGTNSPVVVSLVGGGGAPDQVPVDLNWTNVTSFTVTGNATGGMVFDNLSVNSAASLSVSDAFKLQKALVYPNPVENILYIKNVSDLKSVNVYNNLGQQVLQSKIDTIDVCHLSKGMYFLQIHTSNGTETKRILKK